MNKEDYVKILKDLSKAKAEIQTQFIYSKVFHKMLSSNIIDNLAYDFFRLKDRFKRGAIIFSQHEEITNIFIVKSGRVVLFKDQSINKKSASISLLSPMKQTKRLKLATIGSGEIFGEEGILMKKVRSYGAFCETDCTVLRISLECLNGHVEANKELKSYLIKYTKLKQAQRSKLLKFQLLQEEIGIRNANNKKLTLLGNESMIIKPNLEDFYLNEKKLLESPHDFGLSTKIDEISLKPKKRRSLSINFQPEPKLNLKSRITKFKQYSQEFARIKSSSQYHSHLQLKRDISTGNTIDYSFISMCKNSRKADLLAFRQRLGTIIYPRVRGSTSSVATQLAPALSRAHSTATHARSLSLIERVTPHSKVNGSAK